MSWNDGYERKKFERKQVGQAKRFKDLGMTDEQIQEIYARLFFYLFAKLFFPLLFYIIRLARRSSV